MNMQLIGSMQEAYMWPIACCMVSLLQVTEHFRDLPKHLGVLHVRCTQLSSHCNATALIHTIIHAA